MTEIEFGKVYTKALSYDYPDDEDFLRRALGAVQRDFGNKGKQHVRLTAEQAACLLNYFCRGRHGLMDRTFLNVIHDFYKESVELVE